MTVRRFALIAAAALAIGISSAATAVEPDEMLADPALEARARALSAELRCMVCQNQSLDDSDAPLAKDLRVLLRERLSAGDSEEEVQQFLVARYGDFILLKPRLKPETVLLWATPAAVLLVGVGAVLWSRRRTRPEESPLSGPERVALRKALSPDE